MKDSKLTKKEKIKLVKAICEEECNYLYMEKDIDVGYDHFSPEVNTVYLKENPKTTNTISSWVVNSYIQTPNRKGRDLSQPYSIRIYSNDQVLYYFRSALLRMRAATRLVISSTRSLSLT